MFSNKKRYSHTPSERFYFPVKDDSINSINKSERKLLVSNHRKKGRNCYGRITSRRRGQGHKRMYRLIDFNRNKLDIPAKVKSIEYDPNRSANIALLFYADGEKRYILSPEGIKIGDSIISTNNQLEEYNVGVCMPLKFIPLSTSVHSIELRPGSGSKIARSAGSSAQLISIEKNKAILKMPSGETRLVNANCRATIGIVGNKMHNRIKLGKAGRKRWLGIRPRVRGVAMNPVDHPMGGGEGRTSGGGHPVSPWGQFSKGFSTRIKSKITNSQILLRRNGKKLKKN